MLRPYDAEDAGAVAELWNGALTAEAGASEWYVADNRLSEGKLERIASDPNYDPEGAVVYQHGGRVVGYARVVVKTVPSYEGEPLGEVPAYLEGLVVGQSFRRQGIGTELLEHIESYAQARGKQIVRVACWHSAIAGVSMLAGSSGYRFLVKRGYEAVPLEIKLRLRFEDFSLRDQIVETRERLCREGIQFRHYGDRDRDSFVSLVKGQFPHWWHSTYGPNLDRDHPLPVLIALEDDRVVGFIGFVRVHEDRTAAFTPGVDPEYRGRGIGTVLVNLWGAEVKEEGAVESAISTGTTNYPAQRIYFGMGYENLGEFSSNLTKRLA